MPLIGSPAAEEMRAKWDARREPGTGCHHLSGFAVESSPATTGSGYVDEEPTCGGRVGGQLACATHSGLSFLCAQIAVRSLFFVHSFSGYRRRGEVICNIGWKMRLLAKVIVSTACRWISASAKAILI